MAEGQRWCRVATPGDPGLEGWAAGDFLVEGGGEAAAPGVAEEACLAAVARATGNTDVALLGSEPTADGARVRVGLGPDRAPWRCTGNADGTTGGIMFLSEDAMVPGTEFHATGETECYATSGSGAGACAFGVTRAGNGGGSVTVTLPVGQRRVIFYEGGAPTGFDRSEAEAGVFYEATRAGDGYLIFVDEQGVYIPDAVILGG